VEEGRAIVVPALRMEKTMAQTWEELWTEHNHRGEGFPVLSDGDDANDINGSG